MKRKLYGLSVMPGAAAVTSRIRAAGIPIAVVTNTPAPLATEMLGRAGVEPVRILREFPRGEGDAPTPGETLDVSLFEGVEKVDVTGITKGRGFSGRIKRWNQHRGPDGHGSKNVRMSGGLPSSVGTKPPRKTQSQKSQPLENDQRPLSLTPPSTHSVLATGMYDDETKVFGFSAQTSSCASGLMSMKRMPMPARPGLPG